MRRLGGVGEERGEKRLRVASSFLAMNLVLSCDQFSHFFNI